ncbi:MAG: hypothetical protein ACLFNN_00405 [Candidatus Paceibacterota bacterium]
MKKHDDNQIPENTLRLIKEAQESYRHLAKNLANIVPKIPKFDLPKVSDIPDILKEREPIEFINPDMTREQNAWKRHKEIIDIQNALLGVQSKLLDEQKSNTKLTKVVIVPSALAVIISVIAIFT